MIALIDYGMGNLRSIAKALERVGGDVIVTDDESEIERADKIVLPGVGAFPDGMANLRAKGLDLILKRQLEGKKKVLLGICLGMQLLAEKSYEFGECPGLGLIKGEVKKFVLDRQFKIPHIGWNNVKFARNHQLFNGIKSNADFYFVHSYHFVCADQSRIFATTDYGGEFISVVVQDNIFATQFHPEKSQKAGLKLLENFINWRYVEV